jgi:hypothetical protein
LDWEKSIKLEKLIRRIKMKLQEFKIVWTLFILGIILLWAVFGGKILSRQDIIYPIDKHVDTWIETNGIPFTHPDKLTNYFAERIGIGGAGGIGAPQKTYYSLEKMLNDVSIKNIKTIAVANETDYDYVIRKYWVETYDNYTGHNQLIEIQIKNEPPLNYSIKEIQEDYIVYAYTTGETIHILTLILGGFFLYAITVRYMDWNI